LSKTKRKAQILGFPARLGGVKTGAFFGYRRQYLPQNQQMSLLINELAASDPIAPNFTPASSTPIILTRWTERSGIRPRSAGSITGAK
jgi:hypothetical protein